MDAATAQTEQLNKKKTYPTDEEDVKYEKEIVDAIKKLDIEQRFQFIALNNLVLQKKQQDTELDVEMKDIVNKYNKLQEPLTQASDEIITGKRALTGEEINNIKQYLTEDEITKLTDLNTQIAIPDYWYTAINNCQPLQGLVEEHDKPILKFLTQIDHKAEEENENFTLTFHFSPNEYFENDKLTVKFIMLNEQEPEKTEGTEIKWKEGKDMTKKTITKKQKNKKTGKTREVKKEVDAESFFNLFKTINVDEAEDADEDEGDAIMERLDINFEIAQAIENELLPYHLDYFLGVREPEEEDDMYGDLDDEDEDDDDDDEDEAPKGKKGK